MLLPILLYIIPIYSYDMFICLSVCVSPAYGGAKGPEIGPKAQLGGLWPQYRQRLCWTKASIDRVHLTNKNSVDSTISQARLI